MDPIGTMYETGSRSPMGRGNFEGEGRPILKYRDYCPCAAAMRPFLLNYFDHLLVILLTNKQTSDPENSTPAKVAEVISSNKKTIYTYI